MRRARNEASAALRAAVVVGLMTLLIGLTYADSRHADATATPIDPDTMTALMDPAHGETYALAFGDSYFTGSENISQTETFGRLALNSLGYAVQIRGHGATGYVTGSHIDGWPNYVSQVSDDSLTHLPTGAVEVVVLEGGINDAIVDVDPRLVQLNSNWVMRTLQLRYLAAVHVVLGVTADDTGMLTGKRLAVNDAIRRAAVAAHWRFIDTRAMITPADVSQIIGPDRLHPTVSGHQRLGLMLRRSLLAAGVRAVTAQPPADSETER